MRIEPIILAFSALLATGCEETSTSAARSSAAFCHSVRSWQAALISEELVTSLDSESKSFQDLHDSIAAAERVSPDFLDTIGGQDLITAWNSHMEGNRSWIQAHGLLSLTLQHLTPIEREALAIIVVTAAEGPSAIQKLLDSHSPEHTAELLEAMNSPSHNLLKTMQSLELARQASMKSSEWLDFYSSDNFASVYERGRTFCNDHYTLSFLGFSFRDMLAVPTAGILVLLASLFLLSPWRSQSTVTVSPMRKIFDVLCVSIACVLCISIAVVFAAFQSELLTRRLANEPEGILYVLSYTESWFALPMFSCFGLLAIVALGDIDSRSAEANALQRSGCSIAALLLIATCSTYVTLRISPILQQDYFGWLPVI